MGPDHKGLAKKATTVFIEVLARLEFYGSHSSPSQAKMPFSVNEMVRPHWLASDSLK